jgi:hypothetical protein
VWEWVHDRYNSTYYSGSPGSDPVGPTSGTDRGFRGGSCYDAAEGTRVAGRNMFPPDYGVNNLGLRLARTLPIDADGDGYFMYEDCDDTIYNVHNLCMVAHYPLNGNTTDAITGAQGNNTGASLTTGADGQSNTAYQFGGHFMEWNGYSINAVEGFSASLWFNSNVTGSYDKTLLSASANNDQYTMMFGTFEPEKQLRIRLEDNWSGINWVCDEPYTNGSWHHTVVVWDGGQSLSAMQIYLDGVPCTMSTTYTAPITSFTMEDFWIGGRWGLTDYVDGQQFEGKIDDVRIFNTVLNQTQVDYLYQNVQ